MKNQALLSSKDKSKKNKVSSAAILFGALRVKTLCSVNCHDMTKGSGTDWMYTIYLSPCSPALVFP